MANSKLLKEAIADAKAVRETAIANAKIALEEAFTPQLQSILSKKLQAEMEGEEEDTMEEELDSSDIGNGDNTDPSAEASDAHTELGPDTEAETAEVGDELEEGDGSIEDPTNADDATISEEEEMESDEEEVEEGYHEEEEMEMDEEMEDEDELDLESIIRELEMGMEDDEEVSEEEMDSEEEMHEEEDEVHEEEDEMESEEEAEEAEEEDDMDDEIDLDEILREMGYGDDEEVEETYHEEEEEANEEVTRLQTELEEALSTVKTLQSTINEVNLLNAKLLYANRLFRGYNLTNEQKSKVVENLDRTSSVREVKLVYATLAESMNFTGTEKKTKKVVSEGASKPVASTAPAKEIISENTNVLAERFKQLANIK